MPSPLEIRRLTIDSVSWTPLVAPFGCSRVQFRTADPANDLKVRTTPTDADTEETIPAGVYYLINVASSESMWVHNQTRSHHLWKAGDTICYLQAVAGTGPVVAGFIL